VVRRAECGQNAVDFAKSYSRSHDAVIRVFDEAGDVIETSRTGFEQFRFVSLRGDAKVDIVVPIFSSTGNSSRLRPKTCVFKGAKFGPNSR
jgi:hypothetical protein